MTTIATIAANSWSVSIGGGWIVLMLVGMGLCLVFMLGSMWLMRDGHGWPMCGRSWRGQPPPTDTLTGVPRPGARPERVARNRGPTMMIGMGIFWLAITVGLIWLVRDTGERAPQPPKETAVTILDRRFAEGAVSPDEYRRRRDVLTDLGADAASTASGRS
jgi:hypothetical protein